MDNIVKQAMAKWPNVASVYGWLGLDRRGNWLIKGGRISNPLVAEFISRNYGHDEQGRWYFQNGPQRVFVTLDYTPLVYRVAWDVAPHAPLRIEAHTGKVIAAVNEAWIDDLGIVLLASELGPGVVDDRDLEWLLPCFTDKHGESLPAEAIASAIECLQSGRSANLHLHYRDRPVPVSSIAASAVPATFGFVQRPAQPPGQEECY